MLGVVKTSTGSLTSGLYVVASVEICAALLILSFIPRTKRVPLTAALAH